MWLVGWILLGILLFFIYVLCGLYITSDIDKSSTYIFTWVIYSCLWFSFVNIILLSYFWDTINKKTGPGGIRGQPGERGQKGITGTCSISASNSQMIMSLNQFLDELYKEKTGTSILKIGRAHV